MSFITSVEDQIGMAEYALDGGSVSGNARYHKVHRATCTDFLLRFGQACQKFIDRELRDLELGHVQVDEVWNWVKKKKERVTGFEPDLDRIGEFWLFTALDHETRLIAAHKLGRHDGNTTLAFMSDLKSRLKKRKRKPHDSDDHAYKKGKHLPLIHISTDGFPPYPEAIDEVFGRDAWHGLTIKTETKEGIEATPKAVDPQLDPKAISTSLVERNNLTVRTFMRRFVRDTIAFSKKLENLEAAIAAHMVYYNYCWVIRTIKTTPAVKAGLASEPIAVSQLYHELRDSWPQYFHDHKRKKGAA